MTVAYAVLITYIFGLPFLVRAAGPPTPSGLAGTPPAPGGKKGVTPPGLAQPPAATTTTSATNSIISSSSLPTTLPSSSLQTPAPQSSTVTTTLVVSTFLFPSSSSTFSSDFFTTSTISASMKTPVLAGPDPSPTLAITSMPMTPVTTAASGMSTQQRNLVIILSTVLGVIGIILIAAAIFLACRYRKGQAPFGHRGASPINDQEIDSWRGTAEQKRIPAVDHNPANQDVRSIGLANSPGWTWTTSPTSVHPTLSPAYTIPTTPSHVAKAPNSRVGLTDETVPGADPFIPPIKRQSSRLSKAPPGHARTKSRRSSMSAKSMRSMRAGNVGSIDLKEKDEMPTWYDPEDQNTGIPLRGTDSSPTTPGTSIFDGLNAGGLSPRPSQKPRSWETMSRSNPDIGRAIA